MIDRIEFAAQFKRRTEALVLDIILISKALPGTEEARIIKRQLLRSSSSVAANFSACCHAGSSAEFFSKISMVLGETEEALFWLRLLSASGTTKEKNVAALKKEATEILAAMSKVRKNPGK